jgi:NADH-quinone oxidoreductase subunit L
MVCRLSPMFQRLADRDARRDLFGAAPPVSSRPPVGTAQTTSSGWFAYSTCSQLGYLFFAAGVGAYGAAMFHLFTHAFFKALLFLGAGIVIHAMHHEQDMRFYGGAP